MAQIANRRIYIFGASGSGTTTLGKAVAAALGLCHVDSDDHFWAPSELPFSVKNSSADRLASLTQALGSDGWVLSGSCNDWAGALTEQADLIVFITLAAPVRLKRLIAREQARFGDRIKDGGDMHHIHQGFLTWAQGYDTPNFMGRSLASHESWLASQTIPICRIDSEQPPTEMVKAVISSLHAV